MALIDILGPLARAAAQYTSVYQQADMQQRQQAASELRTALDAYNSAIATRERMRAGARAEERWPIERRQIEAETGYREKMTERTAEEVTGMRAERERAAAVAPPPGKVRKAAEVGLEVQTAAGRQALALMSADTRAKMATLNADEQTAILREQEALLGQRMIPEVERNQVLDLKIKELQLARLGYAKEADQAAKDYRATLKKAYAKLRDPITDEPLSQEMVEAYTAYHAMVAAARPEGDRESEEFFWQQLRMVGTALSGIRARTTTTAEQATSGVSQWVIDAMALTGRTGALTPTEKRRAEMGLIALYNTLLQNAKEAHPTVTWPDLEAAVEPVPGPAGGRAAAIERGGAGPERKAGAPSPEAERMFIEQMRR